MITEAASMTDRQPDSDKPAYHVEPHDESYGVVSPTGMNVMECRDEYSANHYAALLTKAYQTGFRAGFRQAKHGS